MRLVRWVMMALLVLMAPAVWAENDAAALVRGPVSELKKRVKENPRFIVSHDRSGETLLNLAIRWNRKEAFAFILSKDKGAVGRTGFQNMTPLHVACRHLRVDMVKELLARHADPKLPDGNGFRPLNCAFVYVTDQTHDPISKESLPAMPKDLEAASMEIAALLVGAGADPNAGGYNDLTALGQCKLTVRKRAMRKLTQLGATH